MGRIALLGRGLLPFEPGRAHSAHGLRTWQFAAAIARSGHEVDVLVLDAERDADGPPPPPELASGVRFRQVSARRSREPAAISALLDEVRPLAVVGATTLGSYVAASSTTSAPLWLDLHGDPMAEGQAAAFAQRDHSAFELYLWALCACLGRGDRFSVVSHPQRCCLLGQLGLFGRLNLATAGSELVDVVPDAFEAALAPVTPRIGSPPRVLVSGSFNTWTDGETLIRAVERASETEPGLIVDVTGGAIPQHSESAWNRFVERARSSPASGRIVLHGWVANERLAELEGTAHCGVVPELPLVERELGSQNRSLRWIARRLPVITTRLSELGRSLESAGAAMIYETGDAESLARAMIAVSRDPDRARELGAKAIDWLERERSVAATTGPLVDWVRAPGVAPDRAGELASRRSARHVEILSHWLAVERQRRESTAPPAE